METWNRLTDLRGEGGGGDWKRLPKNTCVCVCVCVCIAHNTDNNVMKARGRGGRVEGDKGGGNW